MFKFPKYQSKNNGHGGRDKIPGALYPTSLAYLVSSRPAKDPVLIKKGKHPRNNT